MTIESGLNALNFVRSANRRKRVKDSGVLCWTGCSGDRITALKVFKMLTDSGYYASMEIQYPYRVELIWAVIPKDYNKRRIILHSTPLEHLR